ncbi:hypothetical protein QOZ80_3BG0285080 [Eleusine coracana subsp. coracana]|nr:hypothetical protein QOZ80_3BG0285080 [Eleusine coracana subsp. coracana]
MISGISTGGAHEESNYPSNKKSRLTHRSCPKVDSSKWIGLQRLNFLSLPEDVVSRITAKLTLKEAVRMSVLCSKMRKAWIYHPRLDFDTSTVPRGHLPTVRICGCMAKRNQSSDLHEIALSTERFIDTVKFILREHSGLTLNRLAIKFNMQKEHANCIDGWVSFAITSKAKVVILNFSPYLGPCENNYCFPYHLFNNQNASRLQVLRLDTVTLGSSPDFCGFSSLTTLALEHVVILQDLQNFLLKCPSLEWLSIRYCSQIHNLHPAEPLQQLKFLCVQDCAIDKIELHAPNLATFEYRGGSAVLFALNKCLKLKTVSIAFLVEENLAYVFTGLPNGLPHIESLHVEVTVKTQIHGFTKAPLKFVYLKHLTMKITFSSAKRFGKNAVLQLAYILEAAPFLADLHLDMLCMSCCEYPPKRDVIVDRPHYNLKRACITGFSGNGGQVALVKYILRNAVQLEQMTIDPRGRIMDRPVVEFCGRSVAKEELLPKDKKGVITIL